MSSHQSDSDCVTNLDIAGSVELIKNHDKVRYAEDDLLSLSGIQHFSFCKRQWGLIHIERQWADDLRTTEGHYIHRNADDPFFDESRGDVLITSNQFRSFPTFWGFKG